MTRSVISVLLVIALMAKFGTIANADGNERGPREHYLLHTVCVQKLQEQISQELLASLTYLNMAAHFQNNQVARKGFFRFFQEQSDEEKKHAHKLIHYMNKRGAKVGLFDVPMPKKSSWSSAAEAVQEALDLEVTLNNALHSIHNTADKICLDPHMMDFLESNYLEEQISSINALTKLKTTLDSFGDNNSQLGEYHVDQLLLEEKGRHYFEDEL